MFNAPQSPQLLLHVSGRSKTPKPVFLPSCTKQQMCNKNKGEHDRCWMVMANTYANACEFVQPYLCSTTNHKLKKVAVLQIAQEPQTTFQKYHAAIILRCHGIFCDPCLLVLMIVDVDANEKIQWSWCHCIAYSSLYISFEVESVNESN